MTRTVFALVLLTSLAATAAMAEDDLGRLFFTPAQRAALDAGKQINQPKQIKRAERSSLPARIKLNGVVVRSDGERTVWINGKPYQQRSPAGIRVETSPSSPAVARLQTGRKGAKVDLKVGQQLDRASGQVHEAYELPASDLPAARPARARSPAQTPAQ